MRLYRNSACVPETCFPSLFSSTCVLSATLGLEVAGRDRAWYHRKGTRTVAEEARTPMWKPIVSARQPARMRAADTGAVDESVPVLVKFWLDSVGCGPLKCIQRMTARRLERRERIRDEESRTTQTSAFGPWSSRSKLMVLSTSQR